MLKIYKDLFYEIHKNDIKYCHFKSNDHLDAGLNGKTDLDIVVLQNDATNFIKILYDFNFKRTEAGFGVKNHSREGYLGLDSDTGKLVYIDLHFNIVIGKNRIREYALKEYSVHLINNRILDKKSGVFICSPTFELLLLIIRASIKVRLRDKIKYIFGIEYYNKSWTAQHDWLIERYNPIHLTKLLQLYFNNDIPSSAYKNFNQYPSLRELSYFKSMVRKSFYGSLKYGKGFSFIGMILKEMNGALCWFNRRIFSNSLPINRRYLSSGGKFLAIIGVDGAGKSTQIDHIKNILSWKLDVSNVYLGAGDGRSSWHRSILIKGRNLLLSNSIAYDENSYKHKKGSFSVLKKIARNIWAISLMFEKKNKLKKFHRLSKRATIVISDRYPQNIVKNFNDGPLLSEYNSNRQWSLLNRLSKFEEKVYSGDKYGFPDLVIKLMLDPTISIQRGQSTSIDYLQKRIETVNSMNFSDACPIVEIDASQTVDKVSKDIINAIWQVL